MLQQKTTKRTVEQSIYRKPTAILRDYKIIFLTDIRINWPETNTEVSILNKYYLTDVETWAVKVRLSGEMTLSTGCSST